MGNFYANVTLLGADADRVAEQLEAKQRRAYISSRNEAVVVFDEAGDNQDGSHVELASALSAALSCPAIAVMNHDDDILFVHAFDAGRPLGEYNSDPEYFDDIDERDDGRPAGSSPALDGAALAQLVGRPDAAQHVDDLLRGDRVFEVDRHHALVAALGLPAGAVGVGFRSIAQGDAPAGGAELRLI